MAFKSEAVPVGHRRDDERPVRRANLILAILLLSYMVSYVDRTALSVLQEQLKYELELSDWELGLMSGPAFALLYSFAGLPIARFAETRRRTAILAACLTIWSTMTMVCGAAQNFFQLFVARMGVGIGEAGGNPVAHSLIADSYPPRLRGRAIAVYSLGVPAGAFLGAALVGWLAEQWGWREVFFMLGPPGFILALIALFFIRDPQRGRFDVSPSDGPAPSLAAVIADLLTRPDFRHAAAGASLVVFVGYGVASFLPVYLVRQYDMSMTTVGLVSGVINGLAAGIGTVIGGYLGDRLSLRDVRYLAWVPAGALLLAAPVLVAGFSVSQAWISVSLIGLGTVGMYSYIAPTFSFVHGLSTSRTRATATSIFYLIINLVGMGLGPPVIGGLSDFLGDHHYTGPPGSFAATCVQPDISQIQTACDQALAAGLTGSLLCVSAVLFWASLHFWLEGKSIAAPSENTG